MCVCLCVGGWLGGCVCACLCIARKRIYQSNGYRGVLAISTSVRVRPLFFSDALVLAIYLVVFAGFVFSHFLSDIRLGLLNSLFLVSARIGF